MHTLSINVMLYVCNYIHMTNEDTVIDMPQTTIRINTTTRDRLVELGKKNESYDTIINKLIDEHEQNEQNKKE